MTQRVTSSRLFLPRASPLLLYHQAGTARTRPSPPAPPIRHPTQQIYGFPKSKMMYYSILASFCLLGMASSQTIISMNACLTKEQNLMIEVKFKDIKPSPSVKCTYKLDNKVVATNDQSIAQDSSYKNRATVNTTNELCVLTLKGFSDDQPKTYNCTIQQDSSVSYATTVDKKTLNTCSAGNALKHGGMILLLAFVLPLLSGML